MKVTHIATRYLQTIDELKKNGPVRQVDIAHSLNVRPSTCFEAILRLMKKGLVKENKQKHLFLTTEGETLLTTIKQNQYICTQFFREVMGECCQDAKNTAQQIEPILNLETALNMCRLNHFLDSIRDKKVDFWKEWNEFCLDPDKDKPCQTCAHKEFCLKKRKDIRHTE